MSTSHGGNWERSRLGDDMRRGAGSVKGGPAAALPVSTAQFGLWMFLASMTMLFAGFTSAYLVRQRTGTDWGPIPVPPVLWINTGVLLLSSVTLERGRARLRRGDVHALRTWGLVTVLLGLAFLSGQVVAWRQLAALGLTLPSDPHSSFFYILTGTHGAHLAGGVGALLFVLLAAWRAPRVGLHTDRIGLCATYWHFVGGLWLYLFLLLFAAS